jgi:hypothetical protein
MADELKVPVRTRSLQPVQCEVTIAPEPIPPLSGDLTLEQAASEYLERRRSYQTAIRSELTSITSDLCRPFTVRKRGSRLFMNRIFVTSRSGGRSPTWSS